MRRPLIPALSKAWETFKQTPLGAQVLIHSELTKVKLTSLVVTSTGMGYAMVTAPLFTGPGLSGLATVMGGTLLCAASANTLNQVRVGMLPRPAPPLPLTCLRLPRFSRWPPTPRCTAP